VTAVPVDNSDAFMRAAMDAAALCRNLPSPNPNVGCAIVAADGALLGVGHTQAAGGPHAEIMALRNAARQGRSTGGATAYVTLEPCCHQGRTGPCCEALISAGIARVVASIADPNPLVAGQGFDALRAAGVEVQVGLGAQESRELNMGFFSRMIRKTPWVRLKIAASLDGKTALTSGVSQWITSSAARTDGHAWRARACAVLTGIGTLLKDDPRLDVRLIQTQRQPHAVVVDHRLETPLNASIFIAGRALYIYAAIENESKKMALEARGATVIYVPGEDGRVDLAAMLRDLAQREVNELHVEAGQRLSGALVEKQLVDELLLYLAPKLIGQGMGMVDFGPLTDLAQATALEFTSIGSCGPDLRAVARLVGREKF
jgi:diaminohydroxyphosphoribosylaminopyrimidine deaminase/5-amino-6-(5-phosphoribosylamino)uracil reductase